MRRLILGFLTTCLLVQVKAAPDITLDDLLERLVTLEDWKQETEKEVSTLREIVAKQGVTIKNLERDLAIQANLAATLQSNNQDNNQNTLENNDEADDGTVNERKVSDNRMRRSYSENSIPVQPSVLSKRQIGGGVAFSAYLDHGITPGSKQTIVFNKVITNDGNAYNSHTGIFTCPEAGMYLFSFHIATRSETTGMSQVYAELRVSGHFIGDAVAETYNNNEDDQGGNTFVYRLHQGDTVWVDAGSAGYYVQGSGVRTTTFTGVYLY